MELPKEIKECLAEEAFREKFRAARNELYEDGHDADKIIKEMEKIVSEAEKKWGIWKPDPLSERFSNIGKQVDHIKNYCKFRVGKNSVKQSF